MPTLDDLRACATMCGGGELRGDVMRVADDVVDVDVDDDDDNDDKAGVQRKKKKKKTKCKQEQL
jgi:hypothetical protein